MSSSGGAGTTTQATMALVGAVLAGAGAVGLLLKDKVKGGGGGKGGKVSVGSANARPSAGSRWGAWRTLACWAGKQCDPRIGTPSPFCVWVACSLG